MNTASAHAPTSFQAAPQTSGEQSSHVGRSALIALLSAALVLAGLAGIQILRTRDAGATVTLTTVSTETYVPGGSVYAQQVPTATLAAVEAYLPSGSVYAQQVPAAAAPMLAAYATGGSVYAEQVPTATVLTFTPDVKYLPGGSVYEQQVPAAATGLAGSVFEQQVPAAAR